VSCLRYCFFPSSSVKIKIVNLYLLTQVIKYFSTFNCGHSTITTGLGEFPKGSDGEALPSLGCRSLPTVWYFKQNKTFWKHPLSITLFCNTILWTKFSNQAFSYSIQDCSRLFCMPAPALISENVKCKLCGISYHLCNSKLIFSYGFPLPESTSCSVRHRSPSFATTEVQRLNRQQLEALKQPTSHNFCHSFSGCQMPRLQVDDEGSKKSTTLCDKPPMIMIPIILVYHYLLCQFLVTFSDAAKQLSCSLAAGRN
jgi:hypothetical protein